MKENKKMKQEFIDYPTQEEIDVSVNKILEMAYPKQESLPESIFSMYRQIGLENILHGIKLLLGMVILCYVGMFIWNINTMDLGEGTFELIIVLFLPLMFQGILGLSIVNETEQNVFELGMACRYTHYHVLALRMIAVSVILILLNGGMCIGIWILHVQEEFMQTAFLAVSITLIYSVLYMKMLIGGIQLFRQIALYGVWAGLILGIHRILPVVFEYVVYQLPLVIHVVIWFGALAVFGQELSRFLNCNCKYNLYVGG